MIDRSLITRCSAIVCNAEIAFVANNSGGVQVIDPQPHPKGTIELTIVSGEMRANVLTKAQRESYQGELYIDHHATCANVGQFRRRR